MKCPYCGTDDTKVIDSRPAEENNAIRRRRQCEKCNKRFTTYEKVEDVENTIFNMEKKEIPSQVIGEIVMERLKQLDQVAYVRFASVYREFKDVNTFMDELKKLLK